MTFHINFLASLKDWQVLLKVKKMDCPCSIGHDMLPEIGTYKEILRTKTKLNLFSLIHMFYSEASVSHYANGGAALSLEAIRIMFKNYPICEEGNNNSIYCVYIYICMMQDTDDTLALLEYLEASTSKFV